jgi:hypothetical protein
MGVGRGADMSLTGFYPLWDKFLSQNLRAVADQGCHLEKDPVFFTRGPLVGRYTVVVKMMEKVGWGGVG